MAEKGRTNLQPWSTITGRIEQNTNKPLPCACHISFSILTGVAISQSHTLR